jgi:hypothetical protein
MGGVDVAKVINEVVEGSNFAFRNGKMVCDRNVQTDELDDLDLIGIDTAAKDIRKVR